MAQNYLDFPGLQEYDALIKNYINNKSQDPIDSISDQSILDLFRTSGDLVLSKTSTVVKEEESDTITISSATGQVSVASSDSSIATATLEDNIITITGVKAGSVSITVEADASDTTKPVRKSISVVVEQRIEFIDAVPSQKGTLTYNESIQSPAWNDYDSTKMTISGETTGSNAGIYTVTFTPKANYAWANGSTEGKEVSWTIDTAKINIPSTTSKLTYDGTEQSPTWNDYDSSKISITGTTGAINAGSYVTKFTPKTNYAWNDDTVETKEKTWSIAVMKVAIPSAINTSLTYNNSNQSPTWNNYDSTKMTISGNTSEKNVGNYTANFDLISDNYGWSDSSVGTKKINWSINKANGSITLSSNNVTLTPSSPSQTVTFSDATGTVTATSADTSVAKVSVSGNKITITQA